MLLRVGRRAGLAAIGTDGRCRFRAGMAATGTEDQLLLVLCRYRSAMKCAAQLPEHRVHVHNLCASVGKLWILRARLSELLALATMLNHLDAITIDAAAQFWCCILH